MMLDDGYKYKAPITNLMCIICSLFCCIITKKLPGFVRKWKRAGGKCNWFC